MEPRKFTVVKDEDLPTEPSTDGTMVVRLCNGWVLSYKSQHAKRDQYRDYLEAREVVHGDWYYKQCYMTRAGNRIEDGPFLMGTCYLKYPHAASSDGPTLTLSPGFEREPLPKCLPYGSHFHHPHSRQHWLHLLPGHKTDFFGEKFKHNIPYLWFWGVEWSRPNRDNLLAPALVMGPVEAHHMGWRHLDRAEHVEFSDEEVSEAMLEAGRKLHSENFFKRDDYIKYLFHDMDHYRKKQNAS